jgi:hypothetical protein
VVSLAGLLEKQKQQKPRRKNKSKHRSNKHKKFYNKKKKKKRIKTMVNCLKKMYFSLIFPTNFV